MRRNLHAYASEFAGTALMLFIGVSAVAFMWSPDSPVPIVYSPLGQLSGGHINPAVTLAFWRVGKLPSCDALIYAATVLGEGYSWAGALAAEAFMTFLLVLSLLLDEPRSATVVAATDAQLRRVTTHDFGRVLAEDPGRTQELLRQLTRRVTVTNECVAGGV